MTNNTERYLNANYVFIYNEIKNRTYYKAKKSKSNFQLMQEFDFNSILRKLENAGHKTSSTYLQTLLNSDFVKKVNPIKEYFQSLPAWDGKTDYIKELAKTIATTDDEFFQWSFKK